ncbi:hypothetical protein PLESTB_001620000 [Pleodorina starrii]|uniref:Peptidase C1A papain C-terminal domain-containing protein n=1 Tax=Pleodorina starrii TaxID=330485 RepID=A0A9W6F8Q0_9CHLO|nr:hypothetical protein PLESTB_001620000 [Pleodorina starrii]
MEYTVTLPYMKTTQPQGLKYPVHVWWDGPNQKYRFDVYGGMDSVGWNLKDEGGYYWSLYPRISRVGCDTTNGTDGPVLRRDQLAAAIGMDLGDKFAPLPDISGWSYAGTAQLGNDASVVWQYSVRIGEKTGSYQFYISPNGFPLRLYMMGRNLVTGGHYDEYLWEFTRFKPGPVDAAAFELPGPCRENHSAAEGEAAEGRPQGTAEAEKDKDKDRDKKAEDIGGVAARLGMLLPATLAGGAPVSVVLDELHSRAGTALEANARFVDEHNSRVRVRAGAAASATAAATAAAEDAAAGPSPSYSLALNHFAHLTHEQWTATSLGYSPKGRAAAAAAAAAPDGTAPSRLRTTSYGSMYERVLSNDKLPKSVDWRGTGADGLGVKDQACCGSCWAFAATGAMEGAWFKATGMSLSFSEQQFLDCSWDYGTSGPPDAAEYMLAAGGVPVQEADYPYLGQNGWCKGPFAPTNSTTTSPTTASSTSTTSTPLLSPGARLTGYQHIPPRDEAALMEAVALHGPVAVGIDGGRLGFRFYSEGVYHDPHCGQDLDSMDHAVLLVGYGTTPEGVDYWLIKNSWSKYWGLDGYARIARKGNDCGISTDAVLAVVEKTQSSSSDEEEQGEVAAPSASA